MSGADGTARARHMLGNFEILETLGRGGMGVVYRAFDSVLGRTVALKVLREDLRVQPSLVSRFQREARAVAALDHANIVHVYGVGSIEGIPYISMEFIEGRPLSEILKENKRLEWERAFRIGEQVAQGLAAAHDKHIYHRDIKPANILVDAEDHAYITDFGIAKVLNADTQLTVDGSRLGTPHYMAPERCEGKDATHLSDLYGLGIMLYQCIAGRLPFEAPTPAELIEKILADTPERLADICEDVPEDVDRLVAWTIEKNPRHRPQDGHVLADSLHRVGMGMPLEEEGPNLANALAEFREDFSTPTPYLAKAKPDEERGLDAVRSAMRGAAVRAWRDLPYAAQLGSIVVPMALAAGALAYAVAPPVRLDYVSNLAAAPGHGIERWTQARELGHFQNEGAGVERCIVDLPGYEIRALIPAPAPSAFQALLEGAAHTASAGHNAWVTIDGSARSASLTASPVSMSGNVADAGLWPWHGGELLTVQEAVDGSRWLITLTADGKPTGRVLARFRPGESPLTALAPYTLGALAPLPDGQGIIAALNESAQRDAGWFLAKFVNDGAGLSFSHVITRQGGAIPSVAVSPDGALVAYRRSQGGGSAIYLTSSTARLYDGRLLASGPLALPREPFSTDGTQCAVVVDGPDSRVLLFDTVHGTRTADLPGANAMAWLNGRGDFVVAAPDRRGDRQLWLSNLNGTTQREQLTFINGGVGLPIVTSADGAFAAAPVPAQPVPTFLFAALPAAVAAH